MAKIEINNINQGSQPLGLFFANNDKYINNNQIIHFSSINENLSTVCENLSLTAINTHHLFS